MGYFIPGALLIYITILFKHLEQLNGKLILHNFLSTNRQFQIDQFLFFVIVSYSLGHLINFISSITIEKFAIWKYGYPSKYLLGFHEKNYWEKGFYRVNFFRTLLAILIFPITICDLILGNLFSFKKFYTRQLDNFLITIIKEKGLLLVHQLFKNEEQTEFAMKKYDFFRIFAHYTFENCKNHQTKLINYVVLYGFLRTLSLISVITFWYSLYSAIFLHTKFINFYSVICIALASYIFFMAFMKFYRRYTLEGLMLIAIDKEIN